MDGPGEHYAKWNKPVRERHIPYDSLLCGIQWTNWTNKENGDKLIHGKQMTARGQLEGRLGGGWIEKKGKRAHGHGQQHGDCWGWGEYEGTK